MKQPYPKSRMPAAAVAVALAGGVTGLCAAMTVDAISASDHRAPSPELIEFARDNHLSGLSPASLRPLDLRHATDPELAEFARQNELTGLAPTSLSPLDDGDRHRDEAATDAPAACQSSGTYQSGCRQIAGRADGWFAPHDRVVPPPAPTVITLDRVR